jgi:hypothetical protein
MCFALMMLVLSAESFAQVIISVSFAPPALPVYEQPPLPDEGYIWVPGYWAYADDDYYWVPGTWVMPPEAGFLWTPGYWSWSDNGYVFNDGYWAPTVGFYGGIDYGYGYFGQGYEGGRWQGGQFYYNRSVNNVNVTTVHNIYNTTVTHSTTINRVSYNGGNGGINARPRPEEQAAARERHIPPVAAQTQHVQAARANQELRASANHGKPPVAATPKPAAFHDRAVIPAKAAGAPYKPGANRTRPATNTQARPRNSIPRSDREAPNNQPDSKGALPNGRPTAEPANQPQTDRSAAKPGNRPDSDRAPAAQPNKRSTEPRSNEPDQPPQTSTPSDRSQPQHTPAETPRAAPPQERSQPHAPEEKKEKPKEDKKPPQ